MLDIQKIVQHLLASKIFNGLDGTREFHQIQPIPFMGDNAVVPQMADNVLQTDAADR